MRFVALFITLLLSLDSLNAAPQTAWYLDELGTTSYDYTLDDAIGINDGTAIYTPSTGNASGKICSALDFSNNSTNDYAILDEAALNGANDVTVSFWHKGSSTAERSFLSGSRTAQTNELILWFSNGNAFTLYLNGANTAAISIPSISDDVWHHITWRRAGNQSCIFTDGVQRGCNTTSNKTLAIESLILGQEQDSLGGSFDIGQDWESLVDELLIFRSALTNAEILSVYNNQNAGNTWNGGVRTCLSTPPPPPAIDYSYANWRFDELSWNATPNELIDQQGVHHGFVTNASPVPGKICNAIDLTSSTSSDRANLGAGAIDGAGDFTVSVWHKGTSGNSKGLLSGALSTPVNNELLMWFPNASTFGGFLKNSSLGSVGIGSIHDNAWHHLVWKRTGAQSCFYLDSSLQGCQANNNSSTLNIVSLVLGQDQDNVGGGFSSAQDWEGLVDELLIFRRSLSDSEITSIYNNQNSGKNWNGGVRACTNLPDMSLRKISTVLSDPINNTTNPKRIPGAVVRYTIRAENANTVAAEGVVITDNLNAQISGGNIAWLGNMTVISPNINGGVLKAISDSSGNDEGEFVSNLVTLRCGNVTSIGPCILTYDVEINNSP